MKLKGIKANFLGDSITEGVGVPSVEYTYWNQLKEKYGLAVARGYGISGTRIAAQRVSLEGRPASFDRDFCSRVEEMDPDADLVVVFGGTNDYGHGDAPLGKFSDRTKYSFYGACHTLMLSLIERFPTATLVFMTPLHREVEEQEGKAPLRVYVEIIREVAEFYGIPVMDLYAKSNIQPQIEAQKQAFAPDGLHPNAAGAERIADRLGEFLSAL